MKQFKSLICLLLALLLLSGCAPAAPAQSDASTEPAQTEEAAPTEQTEQVELEAPAEEEATEPEADFITVTDHNDNVVQVPKNAQRIAVCDILPLPSVLCVFFDSAEKLVGIAPSSMSAAQNSLLSQLYPEILNAQTGYMNGTDVNTEELMQLAPDVVFYSASNPALGEKLTSSGFCAVAVSANKWQYNCIKTLNNWIDLLSQIFPENDRAALCRSYSEDVYAMVHERVKDIPDDERARAFFLFQYNDSTIMTSGQLFFGQWWADAIGAVNVANELTTDNSVTVNLEHHLHDELQHLPAGRPLQQHRRNLRLERHSGRAGQERLQNAPRHVPQLHARHRHADHASVDGKDHLSCAL